jgi:periplasmic protein TonB
VHAAILFLFLGPVLATSSFHGENVLGGGGAGPAGGGGGGNGGTPQRVDFIRVKSDPTTLPVAPPVIPPVKPPVVKPVIALPVTPAAATTTEPVEGSSTGGSGVSGGAGSGPGTGGGVGSGIGPGKGSGIGPGTGGGPAKDYPPTPREVFLPPLPQPASVRGQHLRAWFDVDEKGNSKLLSFEKSRDGGYNRLLEQTLKATKFRPGVTAEGVPKRDTAMIEIIF